MMRDDIATLGMGISTPGEMRRLARIAEPDIMVLLNAQAVHLIHFASAVEIADAKAEFSCGAFVEHHTAALQVAE